MWCWRKGREPSWLPLSHPTFIPLLSPEIRMSKPLEAEKQGLDSPSEHTGVWESRGWGQEAGVVGSCGSRWGQLTFPLSLQTLKEMDQTLTTRSGGNG